MKEHALKMEKYCWDSKITFLLGDICSLVTFVRSDICANNIYANDISANRQVTVSPSIRSHLPRWRPSAKTSPLTPH